MQWPAGSFTFMASDLGLRREEFVSPPTHPPPQAVLSELFIVDWYRPPWSTTTTWYVLKKGLVVGEPEQRSVERGTIG
jgi:hypothetical protein